VFNQLNDQSVNMNMAQNFLEMLDKSEDEWTRGTFIPCRNMTLLNCALIFADNIGAKEVVIGFNKSQEWFADQNSDFVGQMNAAARLSTLNKVKVKAPLLNLNRFEYMKRVFGMGYGHVYDNTFSCLRKDTLVPCGECHQCFDRRVTFRILEKYIFGARDKQKYLNDDPTLLDKWLASPKTYINRPWLLEYKDAL
jgi:7-cyano-7-deazaguanine synthase in queuosine biosynthesis